MSGGRVLDVGCGSGAFLELAVSAGWDAVGLEVDPEAVRSAQSRGLDVRQGEIDTLLGSGERFTVITVSHVLEHVHEPLRLLKACRALLEPRGWLWLEVPNFEAPGRSRFGCDWLHLDPPRHLTQFTPQSLSRSLPVKIQLSQWLPATLAEWKARRDLHCREFCTPKARSGDSTRAIQPDTGGDP
jgi:2-polyprenyl-3-methyl-5-hydroxy-6-metoxy-1,4-benzoquinol methylase